MVVVGDSLEQQPALVMGASRGVGRAIAVALARSGCRVVVAARPPAASTAPAGGLAETARLCGGSTLAVHVDARDAAAMSSAVAAAVAHLGGHLTIAVHCVGGMVGRDEQAATANFDGAPVWDEIMRSNFASAQNFALAALPTLRRRAPGIASSTLVFLGSRVLRMPGSPGQAPYIAAQSRAQHINQCR
jgi:3-oxoacyl-[acyl-carrier protein] reductase